MLILFTPLLVIANDNDNLECIFSNIQKICSDVILKKSVSIFKLYAFDENDH